MKKGGLIYSSHGFPGIEALSCSEDFHFGDHIHDGYVLWLNSDGAEQYSLGRNSTVLEPGSISVIEPGVVHSNRPIGKGGRHLRSLYLDRSFFSTLEEMLYGSVNRPMHFQTCEFNDPQAWRLLLELHRALMDGDEKLVLDQLVLALFYRLSNASPGESRMPVRAKDSRLKKVTEYMRENSHTALVLDDLAHIAQCTCYHVIRLFKRDIGMSPHAYLVQLRLEQARKFLDAGVSIGDAAVRAGFSDQSHLTRAFKLRYGLTPGKYALQIRR